MLLPHAINDSTYVFACFIVVIQYLDVETDMSRKPLFITELGINIEGMQFDPDVNKFQLALLWNNLAYDSKYPDFEQFLWKNNNIKLCWNKF